MRFNHNKMHKQFILHCKNTGQLSSLKTSTVTTIPVGHQHHHKPPQPSPSPPPLNTYPHANGKQDRQNPFFSDCEKKCTCHRRLAVSNSNRQEKSANDRGSARLRWYQVCDFLLTDSKNHE
ncbi:hypothetical protein RUM43_006933 [Polyplax serrata]|uniref:Uncharacterized protein n=1 Tax=Polyplax serrata TaxID=468196 RepID=A0AAN8PBW1_POLSC